MTVHGRHSELSHHHRRRHIVEQHVSVHFERHKALHGVLQSVGPDPMRHLVLIPLLRVRLRSKVLVLRSTTSQFLLEFLSIATFNGHFASFYVDFTVQRASHFASKMTVDIIKTKKEQIFKSQSLCTTHFVIGRHSENGLMLSVHRQIETENTNHRSPFNVINSGHSEQNQSAFRVQKTE